jgi:hypothetical protein
MSHQCPAILLLKHLKMASIELLFGGNWAMDQLCCLLQGSLGRILRELEEGGFHSGEGFSTSELLAHEIFPASFRSSLGSSRSFCEVHTILRAAQRLSELHVEMEVWEEVAWALE